MKKSTKATRKTLRIIDIIAVVLYILFLVAERVPLNAGATFADISVYLLFLVFLFGSLFLWKSEFISGLILIVWYGLQWCLVLWVWVDGGMTVILGFPIAVFGVFALIFGISRMRASTNPK